MTPRLGSNGDFAGKSWKLHVVKLRRNYASAWKVGQPRKTAVDFLVMTASRSGARYAIQGPTGTSRRAAKRRRALGYKRCGTLRESRGEAGGRRESLWDFIGARKLLKSMTFRARSGDCRMANFATSMWHPSQGRIAGIPPLLRSSAPQQRRVGDCGYAWNDNARRDGPRAAIGKTRGRERAAGEGWVRDTEWSDRADDKSVQIAME